MPAKNQATPANEQATSSNVPKVYGALQLVLERFSAVGLAKDSENKQQHFKFRGIDALYNALSTYLAEAHLVIVPRVISREATDRETKAGGGLIYTNLIVEYDFVSTEDGSKITACTTGEAMDSGDKSSNKAMSAAYKYLCLQTFCIPLEGDNDADATTHEVKSKQQQAQRTVDQPRDRPESTNTPPQRANGARMTIPQHVKAIMDAADMAELRKAFALGWKQYENPDNPKDITTLQTKLQVAYNARRDELTAPEPATEEEAEEAIAGEFGTTDAGEFDEALKP